MPRDVNGTYTLPAGINPVQSGTTITSNWANTTLSDIETAITDSLDRNGRGGLNQPISFDDGSVNQPGINWKSESNTGFYRAAFGDMRVSVLGADLFRWNGTDVQIWAGGQWNNIVYEGGAGGMPPGSQQYQSLSWNNAGQVWIPNSALLIDYNLGNVTVENDLSATGDLTITGTSDLGGNLDVDGNITLTGTVDGRDIAADAAEQTDHINDALIHFNDTPLDGTSYVRRNRNWEAVAPIGEVIPPGGGDGHVLRWEATGGAWESTAALVIQDDGDVIISAQAIIDGTYISSNSVTFDGEGAQTTGLFTVAGGNLVNRGSNHIWEDNLGGEFMRIQTDGDVGIGKSPAGGAKLDVDGDIYTEGLPLINGAKRLEVRATLPGTPENDVIYFLTG